MEVVKDHFNLRSKKYDSSSNWVKDDELIKKIFDLSQVDSESFVLDIATGTGKLASYYSGKIKHLSGLDICMQMTDKAKAKYDNLIIGSAEEMPFEDNLFDAVICRQGLQFMDIDKVIPQIYRVLKPTGVTVLCHLVAYGETDKDLCFEIQRLRNPSRKNFLLPQTIPEKLKEYNFDQIKNIDYYSVESINQWINHGAIDDTNMDSIIKLYKNADDNFANLHQVKIMENDIFDTMLFGIVKATKN